MQDWKIENFIILFSFICWRPSKKGLRFTLIDEHLQYRMSQFTFVRSHVTMNNGAEMLISTSVRIAELLILTTPQVPLKLYWSAWAFIPFIKDDPHI